MSSETTENVVLNVAITLPALLTVFNHCRCDDSPVLFVPYNDTNWCIYNCMIYNQQQFLLLPYCISF
jgi:hypothetical protein